MFKNPLNEIARDAFKKAVAAPRIVTTDRAVVAYRFAERTVDSVFAPEETDAKIIEILKANPHADLRQLEDALGIEVLNVQKAPDPSPEPKEPKGTPPFYV